MIRVGWLVDKRVRENLEESAFKGERIRIEETKDPVQILKYFGIGVDRSLRELEESMRNFLLALEDEKREVEEDFAKILKAFEIAEQELGKIDTIKKGLEKLKGEIKVEKNVTEVIEELLDKIFEDLNKIGKEIEKVRNMEKEGKELAKEERAVLIYEEYAKKLEKMFNNLKTVSENATLTIEKIRTSLDKNIDKNAFRKAKTNVEECRDKLIEIINGLKSSVEKYGRIFEGMRLRILYKVKEVCRELLRIEEEVKEAEKTEAQARAS